MDKKFTTYKFRAECATDVQAIRAALLPWVFEWQETRDVETFDGIDYPTAGMTVEFSTVDDGPTFNEIQWLLDGISNAHIAAESIQPTEKYTGEREIRRNFDQPTKRPNDVLIERAVKSSRRRLQALQLEIERVTRTIQTYGTALRTGSKWEPNPVDGSSPGYMALVNGPVKGVVQMLRISPPIGCKKWQSKQQQYINERLATIES